MPRRRSEPVKETQMVSLADIAFLIIFFFLLSSSFMKDKANVDVPVAPQTAKSKSQLTVRMDKDRKIFLEGNEILTKEDLEAQLKGELVGRTKPEELQVRFKGDKNLLYKDYFPVYEAISNAGGVIAIMHNLK
jgi:biopolymer transport protein ExbD